MKCKKANNCCNCMKKGKQLGQWSSPSRGQGQFQYGNSTGAERAW